MRMFRGLSFLKRDSGGGYTLASWHSPHSMTWRWFVSFSRFRGDEARVRPLWFGYRTNTGVHGGFRIPFIGLVHWQTQRPMWFRDLYQMKRDEADGLRSEARPPAPPPPSFRPTVIDGGSSLH